MLSFRREALATCALSTLLILIEPCVFADSYSQNLAAQDYPFANFSEVEAAVEGTWPGEAAPSPGTGSINHEGRINHGLSDHGSAAANGDNSNDDKSTVDQFQSQLDAQAKEIKELREQIEKNNLFGPQEISKGDCSGTAKINRIPLVVEETIKTNCTDESSSAKFLSQKFYAHYDGGFRISPFDKNKTPFELKINGWIQFRHHAFSRDVTNWTDNAGVVRSVRNRNAFDVERARLTFGGYALDTRLKYFLQLDGDSDGRHGVDFFDYLWGWEFSDALTVYVGKRKVPASRQWLLGARRTRFVDRPMANDFFRPDRTVGIFAVGKLGSTGHYQAMVGNGYRTANVPNSQTDDRFTFAATNYFDPWGDYGSQLADYDYTCDPLVRFGHSFAYSPHSDNAAGVPLDETDFLRLSDGTRINDIGALAPGVTVSEFDLFFYGLDFAWRHRGWSFNSEVFLRWLNDFRGDGPIPVNELLQRGFYVEGGRFIIPKKLDVNVRYSQVNGRFANRSEIAAGMNWYPLDTHKAKVSFDVTSLDGSPLQNTATDILVGDDGTLFRTQIQFEY